MEPSCVKMQSGRGYWWEGIRADFALVLANKHINSKVDNQVGLGETEGQPLVLKEQFRGSSHGSAKFELGIVGEGTRSGVKHR